jgi:hypothetical protein
MSEWEVTGRIYTSIKCVPCDSILNSIFATPETLIVSLLANVISEHSNRSNDCVCCLGIESNKVLT